MRKLLQFSLIAAVSALSNNLMGQNALDFDGTDDRVDCGTDTSVMISGKTITLEALIYPTAWKTNIFDGNVICKEDNKANYGYMLRVGGGGKLNFAFGDGAWHEINTAALLSLNTWQHIAGTYDGVKMRVYIDGVAVDSLSVSASITASTNANLEIGAHLTYSRYYQGAIDEARVWNVCRTAAEINAYKNSEICTRIKGLRAYYKFNQGKAGGTNFSVKTLTDMSGFNNHGTLSSFSLSGSTSNWIKGLNVYKAVSNATITVSRCDYYFSPSARFKWTTTGTYHDTIPTAMGCDSAITVNLTIKKSTAKTIKAFACESYLSPSGLYTWTKSGTYTDYLRNWINCDSVITVVLKIGGGRDTISPEVCRSYTVPSGKRTYTISGSYEDTLIDYRGCDSIITIDLTILTPSYSKLIKKVCSSYTSPSGKYTYTQKGNYFDTLINYRGCDSVIAIDLEIKKSSATINKTVCNQWKSPSGKYTWTQSGTYFDTIKNYFGCDSALTVNLKVNATTFGNLQVSTCRSYKSPSKRHQWTVTGIYKDTIPNRNGCDSVITIDLTIPVVNIGVTQSGNTLTASSTTGAYQWLNCQTLYSKVTGETNKIFNATATGDYAVEITESSCKDTSACYKVTISGVESLTEKNIFTLHPNPNKGNFEITLASSQSNASVRVMDVSGRVVYEQVYEKLQSGSLQLNQPNGIYFMEIHAPAFHAMQYFVIEK